MQQGTPLNFNLRNSLFGAFVQDTYQATPNVTLTLGLRYELTTARGDKNANKNVNYDLITGAAADRNELQHLYRNRQLPAAPWHCMEALWDQNTVFRAAYDISAYMEGNGVNNMAVMNPPNVIADGRQEQLWHCD